MNEDQSVSISVDNNNDDDYTTRGHEQNTRMEIVQENCGTGERKEEEDSLIQAAETLQ